MPPYSIVASLEMQSQYKPINNGDYHMPKRKRPTVELPLIALIVGKVELDKVYTWQAAIDEINGNADKNRFIANLLYMDNYVDGYNVHFVDHSDSVISGNTLHNLYMDKVNHSKGFMIYAKNPKAPLQSGRYTLVDKEYKKPVNVVVENGNIASIVDDEGNNWTEYFDTWNCSLINPE